MEPGPFRTQFNPLVGSPWGHGRSSLCGMASVEQRQGSVRVSWRLGGGRAGAKQSCTFGDDDPAKALETAFAAKALVEARHHNITRPECYDAILGTNAEKETSAPTFKQWVGTWIAERGQARDVDPGTLIDYERCLRKRAVPFLGHMRLTDINREVMKAWTAWMSSSTVTAGSKNYRDAGRMISARTVQKHLSITGSCLAAAVPRWKDSNPAARIPGERKIALPKGDKFDGMFLDRDEVRLILDHCSPHIRDLVYVAARSGMRIGELVALEVQFVVFSRAGGATILVRKTRKSTGAVGAPKSQASMRDITVSAKVAEVLRPLVKGRRPSELVFRSPQGRRWDIGSLRRVYWCRAVAEARRCPEHLPPAPKKASNGRLRYWRDDEVSTCQCPGVLRRAPRIHDLRHTHASMLIDRGWHAKKIQLRLGHASYMTTMQTYGHLADLGGPEELEVLEDWFESPAPASASHRRAGALVGRTVQRATRRRQRLHQASG